jgi:hypothetical protein
MVTEAKGKKNMDYSASAVNMCNPKIVSDFMATLQVLKQDYDMAVSARNAAIPATLQVRVLETEAAVNSMAETIKAAVEQYGSYQDLETGHYALKQKAITVNYLPVKCHEVLPAAMVAAVIVESVDKGTVEALVKAGRITPEQQENISEKKESYRFIIR